MSFLQGQGVFAQSLSPLPFNHPGLVVDLGVGLWAWPVPGKDHLFVSCPDKPSNGIWKFTPTDRRGADDLPIYRPATKLSGTKHYVMPSYIGDELRVLSPGFEYRDFATVGLAKPVKMPIVPLGGYVPMGTQPKGPKVRHNQWRYVDFDGDGRLDLVQGVEDWSRYGWDDGYSSAGRWTQGPLHGTVRWHRNTGTDAVPNYAAPVLVEADGQPIDVFGCPSPNFVDFDGDGDLDLLCGEFLDGFTYFRNVGTRTAPRYERGVRLRDGDGTPIVMELQMIVPVAFDFDHDGHVDLVVGDEDGRVAVVRNTRRFHADGSPVFDRPRYLRQEAEHLKCGALATPVGVDWDGDGDTDLLCGNTAGVIEFFENLSGPKVASPKWAAPKRLDAGGKPFRIMAGTNGSIQGPAEAKWGYTCFSVADWDGDGLPDIVLNSILGEIVWLKNVGTRTRPKLDLPRPIEVEWDGEQPTLAWGWRKPHGKALLTQWRTTPVAFDATGDGVPDLIVLDHDGYLALFERSTKGGERVLSHPRRAFADEAGRPLRLNAKTAGGSGRRKIAVTDWDGDGQFDLLVNSANADWYRGLGQTEGVWRFAKPVTLATQNIEGHDVSPTTVDFDGDGIPDFLGGAEDGRLYWLKNPRSR